MFRFSVQGLGICWGRRMWGTTVVYRGYIGIMEKKMETTMLGLGFRDILGFYGGITPIMENEMENMEN